MRLGRLSVVHTTGVCLSCGCNLGLSLSEVLDFCNKQAVADAGCCGLKFMSFSVFCIHQLPPSETQRGPAIGGQCSLHEGQKGQQGTPRGAHDSPEPTQPEGLAEWPILQDTGGLRKVTQPAQGHTPDQSQGWVSHQLPDAKTFTLLPLGL